VKEECWNLRKHKFRPGVVYKTHDFPNEALRGSGAKVLFLYGLPSETVMSLVRCRNNQGIAWVDRHLKHMHAIGTYDDMFKGDTLRIGDQLERWYSSDVAPILGLRYEALWDNAEMLSAFLGFPIVLPPNKTRVPHAGLPKELVLQIRSAYRNLDKKVLAMPDFFLRNSDDALRASDFTGALVPKMPETSYVARPA
jgi:hypothetical protein